MNIEAYFKEIKDFSKFPDENYGSLYLQLATIFKNEIHPEIKTKILEIEEEGYYNDHGIEHINMGDLYNLNG